MNANTPLKPRTVGDLPGEGPPPSATPAAVAWVSLASFCFATWVVVALKPFSEVVYSATFVLLTVAIAIVAVDVAFFKVHLKSSTGLDYGKWSPSWERTLIKFSGYVLTIVAIGFFYLLFDEYTGEYYERFLFFAKYAAVVSLALAIPYIFMTDARMVNPFDGYWHAGLLFSLQWKSVDTIILKKHALGWMIKGFFLPLMFTFFCNSLVAVSSSSLLEIRDFDGFYEYAWDFLFLMDVSIACIGYILSLRIFDTHLRSPEPTTLGWLVAVVCYPPFWNVVGGNYLEYGTDYTWGVWLEGNPTLYNIWGSIILILIAIYVWATVIFGARFSNLTHRGIITNGPYRFTKHPAYISKNIFWWLVAVPFLIEDGSVIDSIRNCILLLMVNFIYYMRAKTEEAHLSFDPDYVAYALWIDQNGMFRRLHQLPLLGWLRYRPPEGYAPVGPGPEPEAADVPVDIVRAK